MTCKLSYRCMCVTDLVASLHFYVAVFGFVRTEPAASPEGNGGRAQVARLRNAQGVELQLVAFRQPLPAGSGTRRPMTERGMTHLNFYVRDLEDTLADVLRHGGQVIEHTRVDTDDGISMVYCTDPDGIRVEVWTTTPYGVGSMAHAIAGIDRRFSHSGICVADLDCSMAFYRALGFETAEQYDYRKPPGQLDRMMEANDTVVFAQMMRNDDDIIELLHFEYPTASGDGSPGKPDRLGLTGLAFAVQPIETFAANLALAGGRLLTDSQPIVCNGRKISYLDPDGVKVELTPSDPLT